MSVSAGKKAYDTSHAFRLPQVRTYERVLIVLLFQAEGDLVVDADEKGRREESGGGAGGSGGV